MASLVAGKRYNPIDVIPSSRLDFVLWNAGFDDIGPEDISDITAYLQAPAAYNKIPNALAIWNELDKLLDDSEVLVQDFLSENYDQAWDVVHDLHPMYDDVIPHLLNEYLKRSLYQSGVTTALDGMT